MYARAALSRVVLARVVLPLSVTWALFGCATSEDGKSHGATAIYQSPLYFPDCVLAETKDRSLYRFRYPEYYRFMVGDGLRQLSSVALADRIASAAKNGEIYKALYFSRLLTEREKAAGSAWQNRARLAKALGLQNESVASEAIANNPNTGTSVPRELLPGVGLDNQPKTLSDWAAAMALLADGMADKNGPSTILAVKDSVSGIYKQIEPASEDMKSYVFLSTQPIAVNAVLPNIFQLADARPMSDNDGGGSMALALLGGFVAGVGRSRGFDMSAVQKLSESQVTNAYSGGNLYKGGSYTSVTFKNGTRSEQKHVPKPSGALTEVIDLPYPILWASGASMQPTVQVRYITDNGRTYETNAYSRILESDPQASYRYSREERRELLSQKIPYPILHVPRLAQLCKIIKNSGDGSWTTAFCTPPLSLMELLITDEDATEIQRLDPSVTLRSPIAGDIQRVSQYYGSENLTLGPYFSQGFDETQTCFSIGNRPQEWIVPLRQR